MSITREGTGTAAGGSTSVAPAYPTGVAANRLAVLRVESKPDTGTINTPTGFTAFPDTNGTGGTGSQGVDTGPMHVAVFYRVLDGTESGTVTVSITSGNSSIGVIDIYGATGGFDTAAFKGTTGADSTHGTAWSATGGADLDTANGDWLLGVSACCSNASNNLTISSRAVSATGSTFSTLENLRGDLTNTGNDSALDTWDVPVTGGPSSAAPVYTSTHSANNSGVTAFARIVEAAGGVTLVVADAVHGHTADNVALTQVHQLAVADATQGHTADNLALTQVHVLAVADALHGHTADNLALTQAYVLVVQDALHDHTADNLALTQVHVLVVQDAAQGQAADNVTLSVGGPAPIIPDVLTLRAAPGPTLALTGMYDGLTLDYVHDAHTLKQLRD